MAVRAEQQWDRGGIVASGDLDAPRMTPCSLAP